MGVTEESSVEDSESNARGAMPCGIIEGAPVVKVGLPPYSKGKTQWVAWDSFSWVATGAIPLRDKGVGQIDGFLGTKACEALRTQLEALHASGCFSAPGRIGPVTAAGQTDATARGDVVFDFDDDERRARAPALHGLSTALNILISFLDQPELDLGLNLDNISASYMKPKATFYAEGRGYTRHVDNPGRDGRELTFLYYLNPLWEPADGGALRLHPPEARCEPKAPARERPVDIAPVADRLLFFWADRRSPHEVLPANRGRYAVQTWFVDMGKFEAHCAAHAK